MDNGAIVKAGMVSIFLPSSFIMVRNQLFRVKAESAIFFSTAVIYNAFIARIIRSAGIMAIYQLSVLTFKM